MKFDAIIKSILKENEHTTASIGTLLYHLRSEVGPEHASKVDDVIEAFNEVINRAKRNSDQPETLEMLLKDLSLD